MIAAMFSVQRKANMGELKFSAERLALLMDQQGVSNLQLAKRTGISKSMIYYLRTGGRQTTSVENARKLADALGVTSEYFIGAGETDDPILADLPLLIHELTQVAKQLSSRRQRDLLLMARAYLEAAEAARTDPDLLMDNVMDAIEEAAGKVSRDQLIDLLNSYEPLVSSTIPLIADNGQ